MNQWKNASEEDLRLYKVISHFLSHRLGLTDFIFHPSFPRLRKPSEELLSESMELSSSDQTLIQIAVNLWSGEGQVNLNQFFALDLQVFDHILAALKTLREGSQFNDNYTGQEYKKVFLEADH